MGAWSPPMSPDVVETAPDAAPSSASVNMVLLMASVRLPLSLEYICFQP